MIFDLFLPLSRKRERGLEGEGAWALLGLLVCFSVVSALDDGPSLFRDGRLSEARSLFEKRVAVSKADREAVAYLARLERNPARSSALYSLLADGQTPDRHAEEALQGMARAAYASGDYAGAIRVWNRLIKGYPASALRHDAQLWKGIAFLSDNLVDSAAFALTAVPESASVSYGRAQAALGLLLSREGRLAEAREYLDRAYRAGVPEVTPPVLLQLYRNALAVADTAVARKSGSGLLHEWPGSIECLTLTDADRAILRPAPAAPVVSTVQSRKSAPGGLSFTLQFGAFKSPENAAKLKKKMDALPGAFGCEILESARNGGSFFLVRMGRFPGRDEAVRFAVDVLRLRPEEYKALPQP